MTYPPPAVVAHNLATRAAECPGKEATAPALPVLTQAPPAPIELPAGNGEWLDIARALAGSMADQAALVCERLEAARSARAIAAPGVERLLARIGDCYCALEDLRHMVAEAKEAAGTPTTAGDTEKGGSHA